MFLIVIVLLGVGVTATSLAEGSRVQHERAAAAAKAHK